MKIRTIKLSKLDCSITYTVKDDSVRGCHTVNGTDLKVGDKVLINNYFHEIVGERRVIQIGIDIAIDNDAEIEVIKQEIMKAIGYMEVMGIEQSDTSWDYDDYIKGKFTE